MSAPTPPPCLITNNALSSSTAAAAAAACSLNMDTGSHKKGIITSILTLDSDVRSTTIPSLSVDMSSKQWLPQNGFFSSMSTNSGEGEGPERETSLHYKQKVEEELERPRQIDLWSSILSQNQINGNGGGLVSKSSIDGALPPPYVHPMVKRFPTSLSGKSLEVCTESLGSETGSDGFSSYPPSEPSDDEDPDDDEPLEVGQWGAFDVVGEEFLVSTVMYNYSTCRKVVSPAKSFPPPLPSLGERRDGSNLQMRSHRQDGRLVMEAVSIPSQNCFFAQRQEGRLLLTLAATAQSEKEEEVVEGEEIYQEKTTPDTCGLDGAVVGQLEEVGEEESNDDQDHRQQHDQYQRGGGDRIQAGKELTITKLMEDFPKLAPRMGMMMNVTKLFSLTKTSSTPWAHRFNKVVTTLQEDAIAKAEDEDEEEEEEEGEEGEQSAITPRSRVARLIPTTPSAGGINTYECYWRSKPTPVAVLKPLSQQAGPPHKSTSLNCSYNNNDYSNKFIIAYSCNKGMAESGGGKGKQQQQQQQKELLVFKGKKAEDLVPLLRGCKEQRTRSLLFLGPSSIATSTN